MAAKPPWARVSYPAPEPVWHCNWTQQLLLSATFCLAASLCCNSNRVLLYSGVACQRFTRPCVPSVFYRGSLIPYFHVTATRMGSASQQLSVYTGVCMWRTPNRGSSVLKTTSLQHHFTPVGSSIPQVFVEPDNVLRYCCISFYCYFSPVVD